MKKTKEASYNGLNVKKMYTIINESLNKLEVLMLTTRLIKNDNVNMAIIKHVKEMLERD